MNEPAPTDIGWFGTTMTVVTAATETATRKWELQAPIRGASINRELTRESFCDVSSGVDTCRVPLCWRASQCPWHRRGRCLFWHLDADAGVKPPMTRTDEEMGAELAALWKAVSKLAATLK